jgi:hypothetical protein
LTKIYEKYGSVREYAEKKFPGLIDSTDNMAIRIIFYEHDQERMEITCMVNLYAGNKVNFPSDREIVIPYCWNLQEMARQAMYAGNVQDMKPKPPGLKDFIETGGINCECGKEKDEWGWPKN